MNERVNLRLRPRYNRESLSDKRDNTLDVSDTFWGEHDLSDSLSLRDASVERADFLRIVLGFVVPPL